VAKKGPGKKRGKTSRAARSKPRRGWVRMKTANLLDVRICDLDLRIEGTQMARNIAALHAELEHRGLNFKPYFWVSDEWFTPDAMTGIAVPFFLLHPRLVRLERRRMGYIEGATREWCMRILRHESGHAIQHAYELNRRRRWQQLFGLSSSHYPHVYRPNPYSRRHVQHLEYWYAQSHPDEDFAETFAVWLAGPRYWRRKYAGWPALRKLLYVDELMQEIAGQKPRVRTRNYIDPVKNMRSTLREYYAKKANMTDRNWPRFYDRDLRKLFSDKPGRGRMTAAAFIRRVRSEVVEAVSPWLGEHSYHLRHVITEMVGRCGELKLRATGSEGRLKRDLMILLAKYTTDCLYRQRGWLHL